MKENEVLPVKNYLLVELEEKDESEKLSQGGIIVNNKKNDLHLRKGKILKVSRGYMQNGVLVQPLFAEGQTIIVSENCMSVRVDEVNTRLVLIPETEVLMICVNND